MDKCRSSGHATSRSFHSRSAYFTRILGFNTRVVVMRAGRSEHVSLMVDHCRQGVYRVGFVPAAEKVDDDRRVGSEDGRDRFVFTAYCLNNLSFLLSSTIHELPLDISLDLNINVNMPQTQATG